MKFIDFFAGIGGFRLGLEMAGHECVGFCEYDKFAVASYRAMHDTEGEWYGKDIRVARASELPRSDIWCFGFPCQDISVAGKQTGFKGNRSSLFFAVTRLIRDTEEEDRPSILFIENVKNLLSVNGGWDFAKLLIELDEIGYDAEWEVLNSKDFGVPQNRERVFIIGHLRGRSRREVFPIEGYDEILIDTNSRTESETKHTFSTISTNVTRKESNYVVKVLGNVNPSGNGMNGNVFSSDGLAPTLTTNKGEGNKIAIPVLTPDRLEKRQNGRRFKTDGEPMFTLTGQNRRGVMVKVATKQGYAIAEEGDSINREQPNSKTRRGSVGKGVAQTITTSPNQATIKDFRIRKLTPKECFRLQGWPDEYFEKAKSVNSDSQLYKQAGNGVTVNVIYEIAKRLGS